MAGFMDDTAENADILARPSAVTDRVSGFGIWDLGIGLSIRCHPESRLQPGEG
jgi:hypothetical protein